MSVTDLWKGKSKAEIAALRKKNAPRWRRSWRGPDVTAAGRPRQHTQRYKEAQKVQADLDDATQRAQPRAVAIRRASVTVGTLLDRHLAARADRAPKTVEVDRYHASRVRAEFGPRVVSTLTPTEIETWTQRPGVARSSRKKQLEMLRAALQRGIRDHLIDSDPTEGLVVQLHRREVPHWSSAELMAVAAAARDDTDRALILTMGLMGLRPEEALTLRVGDLAGGHLVVHGTKTDSAPRTLPVPATLKPLLTAQAGARAGSEWMFPSPRVPGAHLGESAIGDALTRALAAANRGRADQIQRIPPYGLRHTFAAISLAEAHADILSVSRMMGHSRPSVTLDWYGHLAPAGLTSLTEAVDDVVRPDRS